MGEVIDRKPEALAVSRVERRFVTVYEISKRGFRRMHEQPLHTGASGSLPAS
jgi:hypothetical protein